MSFVQGKLFKLKGKVQHYAWGGTSFIPAWLGVENTGGEPCAEYWMGAHPSASSDIITSNGVLSLYQLVKEYPADFISQKVQDRFGELPYLFKILDVKDMLSIQVHPTKEEAEKGYAAEEAAGIKISTATRNYKDKNHKPEVMVALSEFWLLHGFKTEDDLRKVLTEVPEFNQLLIIFESAGYKGLYKYVMELPQHSVDELLLTLVHREVAKKNAGESSKDQPGWWVAKLFENNAAAADDDIDRGIFSIYFFNIVGLQPGEAVFQGAGIPHAYLEGQNVELMANSDNVLRGGLTSKHVDVPELLKHTICEPVVTVVMKGEEINEGEKTYPCPVPDFGITKIELTEGQAVKGKSSSMEIIVIMEGSLQVTGTSTLDVKRGEAFVILPGESYMLTAGSKATAYKAFVP